MNEFDKLKTDERSDAIGAIIDHVDQVITKVLLEIQEQEKLQVLDAEDEDFITCVPDDNSSASLRTASDCRTISESDADIE